MNPTVTTRSFGRRVGHARRSATRTESLFLLGLALSLVMIIAAIWTQTGMWSRLGADELLRLLGLASGSGG